MEEDDEWKASRHRRGARLFVPGLLRASQAVGWVSTPMAFYLPDSIDMINTSAMELKNKNILDIKPDFSSMAGIMTRFRMVPYEQFRDELDNWFYDHVNKSGIDNREALFSYLSVLVKLIDVQEVPNDRG